MASSKSLLMKIFVIATKGRSNLLLNRDKSFEREAKKAAEKEAKAAKDESTKQLE